MPKTPISSFNAGSVDHVPRRYRGPHRRALTGEVSPRQAIKAKCLDCCGWQAEEVRQCTVRGCPLWVYRPFQADSRMPRQSSEPVLPATSENEIALDDLEGQPEADPSLSLALALQANFSVNS
jgi:hypothetical protein